MFDFIVLLSAIIFLAVKLESDRPSITFPRKDPSCTSMVSRYFTIALVSFHGLTFARVRVAGRVLRQAGMKFARLCPSVLRKAVYLGDAHVSLHLNCPTGIVHRPEAGAPPLWTSGEAGSIGCLC